MEGTNSIHEIFKTPKNKKYKIFKKCLTKCYESVIVLTEQRAVLTLQGFSQDRKDIFIKQIFIIK